MKYDSLDLNKIKEEISNDIIEELVFATSDYEKKLLKEELISKINKNTLITEIDVDQYEVSSEKINKNMNELYIDLLTSFAVINSVSQGLSRYNVSNLNYTDYIKARVNEINDKFESCNHSLSYSHMPSFIIERFRNADKFDKTRFYHKDRYDQWIPSRCYVNFDSKQNHITLPIIRQDNSLRYDEKVATATLSAYFQLGRGFLDLSTNETDIQNAIDESSNTFWSETILSDSPFRVSFDTKKPKELYVDDNYFYGIDNGAVCDLEINFESLNTVNEITLEPYTKYPIRILAIRYKTTDDEDEPLVEIVTPDNKDKTLREVFTNGKVSYKFPDILCKKIYILFTQEHYTRGTYIYNPSDVYKNDLWFSSKNSVRDKVANAIFKPNYHDRSLNDSNWQNLNDKIISSTNNDLTDIIIKDEKNNRKVVKYEYNYGFYNIGCFNNHFDRTGMYIGKDIRLDSNIKNIKITTDEDHQLDSLGNSVTDIEYYITVTESPTSSDWVPIMPVNKEIIKSETLFITAGTRAYLRFEADEVYSVMKNGEAIPTDSNEYHLDTNERTGKIWCVQIFNYDYDAVYSISYKPVPGHKEIDFSDKIATSIQSFCGGESNYFKLENDPFIDKTLNYCSIKLTDTSGTGNEIEVENVTDVSNQSYSYKNFDYSSNKYQFYINKNIVYFNKPISDDYIIDVSYRHLVSKFKLKALFRRNTTKDGWLTPILKEIKYDVETF